MNLSIKIFIVTEYGFLAEALTVMFARKPGFELSGVGTCPRQAIQTLQREQPHIVLVEAMVSGLTPGSVSDLLSNVSPKPKLAIISKSYSKHFLALCLKAGVTGFFLTSDKFEDLCIGLEKIASGEAAYSAQVSPLLPAVCIHAIFSVNSALTARETEVVRLKGLGYTTKEVAQILCLSVKTIDTYLENLRKKLDIKTTRGSPFTRIAFQLGILDVKSFTS